VLCENFKNFVVKIISLKDILRSETVVEVYSIYRKDAKICAKVHQALGAGENFKNFVVKISSLKDILRSETEFNFTAKAPRFAQSSLSFVPFAGPSKLCGLK